MEAGKDVLIMHLCSDTVPENQEFILHEVSDVPLSAIYPGL